MTYKIDLLHRTERDCRVLYCAAVPNISSVTVGETYLCHFLSFLIEKLWFTVLCIQMQSLSWKFGMWDITTVNLKSHPEIKINGLYFNWKLQLLWASEKSKMVVSLIEFPLEFLPELESVSIFIFVSKYHVSIFLPIYLAGKIPFSLRQIHEKIIVPRIARKDGFAFRPFTLVMLHWQNSKSPFFGTWSTNSAHCKCAKNWQKNWIILHRLFLIISLKKCLL